MHPEVREWVGRFRAEGRDISVLDIGGRNVNGTTRDLFPGTDYVVLDRIPAPGVDIACDAADFETDRRFDIVLCTEVFEHTPRWAEICSTAFTVLKPGGRFVVTCAAPGRGEHSAIDGNFSLHPGEHYANVAAADLVGVLGVLGFIDIEAVQTESFPCDTRATAIKPAE